MQLDVPLTKFITDGFTQALDEANFFSLLDAEQLAVQDDSLSSRATAARAVELRWWPAQTTTEESTQCDTRQRRRC